MKKLLLSFKVTIILLLIPLSLYSKSVEDDLMKFKMKLRDSIALNKSYPAICSDANITGISDVTFVVERNGSVSNIRIHGGSYGCLNKASIRSIKSSFPIDIPKNIRNNFPFLMSIKFQYELEK